jgi:LysR family transcriptional regulator, transcriptional activator for dmlA
VVKIKGSLVSNSGELVRDWCLSGRGIMLRSLWDVAPLIASGALVRLLPSYAMRDANIQWLAPFRAQTPKRVQLLRAHLMARFKARPWEK